MSHRLVVMAGERLVAGEVVEQGRPVGVQLESLVHDLERSLEVAVARRRLGGEAELPLGGSEGGALGRADHEHGRVVGGRVSRAPGGGLGDEHERACGASISVPSTVKRATPVATK